MISLQNVSCVRMAAFCICRWTLITSTVRLNFNNLTCETERGQGRTELKELLKEICVFERERETT